MSDFKIQNCYTLTVCFSRFSHMVFMAVAFTDSYRVCRFLYPARAQGHARGPLLHVVAEARGAHFAAAHAGELRFLDTAALSRLDDAGGR